MSPLSQASGALRRSVQPPSPPSTHMQTEPLLSAMNIPGAIFRAFEYAPGCIDWSSATTRLGGVLSLLDPSAPKPAATFGPPARIGTGAGALLAVAAAPFAVWNPVSAAIVIAAA